MSNKKKKIVKVKVKKVIIHHPDCEQHANKKLTAEQSQRMLAAINENHPTSYEEIV